MIAAGLSAFAPENVAIEAGRIMLCRLDELASAGANFAFETTLASRSFAPWIARLRRERGYRFHLFFLWLPDANMAVDRVAARVAHGGHSVPASDIRRRYLRGLHNLRHLYSPIADSWEMHENASPPPRLIVKQQIGGAVQVHNQLLWEAIQKGIAVKEREADYEVEARIAGIPIGEVMEIFDRAGREALKRHRALAVPAVIWRDGKVVKLSPDEIDDFLASAEPPSLTS